MDVERKMELIRKIKDSPELQSQIENFLDELSQEVYQDTICALTESEESEQTKEDYEDLHEIGERGIGGLLSKCWSWGGEILYKRRPVTN